MGSLLTAATLAMGLGLAVPAVAQVQQPNDPGRTSPLAQKDPGQESPLAKSTGSHQAQARDCSGMWKRADTGNKGVLEGKDLDKLRSVLNTVDTNKDGKVSQSEFMTACSKGELRNVQL
jgi:hypothetical protein